MRVSISISVNSESGQISFIDDNVHEGMTTEALSDVKFEAVPIPRHDYTKVLLPHYREEELATIAHAHRNQPKT